MTQVLHQCFSQLSFPIFCRSFRAFKTILINGENDILGQCDCSEICFEILLDLSLTCAVCNSCICMSCRFIRSPLVPFAFQNETFNLGKAFFFLINKTWQCYDSVLLYRLEWIKVVVILTWHSEMLHKSHISSSLHQTPVTKVILLQIKGSAKCVDVYVH